MKGPSLYDLDFFWRTSPNHCNLDKKLRPWRGGGPSGLKGYLASGRIGEAVALRVGVLGPVMAWHDDQELPVGQPRQQAVLGILAMRANRVISRGELVDAVWGQDPPASAEGGIYTYVAAQRPVGFDDPPQAGHVGVDAALGAGGGILPPDGIDELTPGDHPVGPHR